MAVTAPLTARDPRLAPWRAFLLAHARVSRRLDEELRAEHDLSLGEYDALLTIAQAPGRRVRMNQLAEQVVLSKSGVTRLIDRLVADGLVARIQCQTDARGAEAVLTDSGLARLRSASGTHLRGVQDHFLDVVEPDDLPGLERALSAVADRAGPSGSRGGTVCTGRDPGRGADAPLPEPPDGVVSTRDERIRVSGMGTAVLPVGSPWSRSPPPLRRPTGRVRAEHHLLRQPTAERISAWLDATPETFRFSVKAQRGGSLRAITGDPTEASPG
jgi:DNA-binding MarR family transcriptional regulator